MSSTALRTNDLIYEVPFSRGFYFAVVFSLLLQFLELLGLQEAPGLFSGPSKSEGETPKGKGRITTVEYLESLDTTKGNEEEKQAKEVSRKFGLSTELIM